jgi:hypothetical protein
MKNLVKTGLYTTAWVALAGLNAANAAITFDSSNQPNDNIKGTDTTADNVIENWVGYLVGFLYLIAIIMMLWGGFQILTAGGDEEKVKKWKTILIQAVAGLIVVFIANSIITWLIIGLFPNA